jgi:hypothetical protein
MKFTTKTLPIALFLLFFAQKIKAQIFTDTFRVRILTERDEIIFGKIVWRTDSVISIRTSGDNRRDIPISEIYRIQFYGKNRPTRSFDTQRNSFASSGYLVEKGQYYFQNVAIYYNHVAYGFRKNWMIHATGSLLLNGILVSCGAKYQLPFFRKRGATSIGFGQISGLNQARLDAFGVGFYASIAHTLGSRDRNLTIGMAKIVGQFLPKDYPVLQLSAKIKLTNRWQFISENLLYPDLKSNRNGFLMFGFRLVGKSRTHFDFGFCSVIKNEEGTNAKYAIPLPYICLHFLGKDGRDAIQWK